MQSRASLQVKPGSLAAFGHDFVIETNMHRTIRRYSMSGAVLASYECQLYGAHDSSQWRLTTPALSPCGVLFCVGYNIRDEEQHEICVFDSHSLQLQRRFGQGLLNNVQEMAVGGDSLYVSDRDHDCIQVFSFAGELLRTIRGEWRRPTNILCVRDRLYLIEEYDEYWDADEDARPEGYSPEIGRRVFVMSLAGEALQTYAPELEAGRRLESGMAVLGENLVLKDSHVPRLLALKGL